MIDFIGIGFRRCASSFINDALFNIPYICKPYSGLHYFNYHFERGLDWYHDEISKNETSESIRYGEFSTTYSYTPFLEKTVNRLYNYRKDIKIICCVRHPIDRFISDYNRSIALGFYPRLDKDLLTVATNDYSLLSSGMYGYVLECFLNKFSLDNFLILNFDDLQINPSKSIINICRFLDVRSDFNVSNKALCSYSRHNTRRSDKFVKFKKFIKRKLGIKKTNLLNREHSSFDKNSFRNINWLESFYREDIEKFRILSGKNFF